MLYPWYWKPPRFSVRHAPFRWKEGVSLLGLAPNHSIIVIGAEPTLAKSYVWRLEYWSKGLNQSETTVWVKESRLASSLNR